jgi:hypothetical protein
LTKKNAWAEDSKFALENFQENTKTQKLFSPANPSLPPQFKSIPGIFTSKKSDFIKFYYFSAEHFTTCGHFRKPLKN